MIGDRLVHQLLDAVQALIEFRQIAGDLFQPRLARHQLLLEGIEPAAQSRIVFLNLTPPFIELAFERVDVIRGRHGERRLPGQQVELLHHPPQLIRDGRDSLLKVLRLERRFIRDLQSFDRGLVRFDDLPLDRRIELRFRLRVLQPRLQFRHSRSARRSPRLCEGAPHDQQHHQCRRAADPPPQPSPVCHRIPAPNEPSISRRDMAESAGTVNRFRSVGLPRDVACEGVQNRNSAARGQAPDKCCSGEVACPMWLRGSNLFKLQATVQSEDVATLARTWVSRGNRACIAHGLGDRGYREP